MDSEYKYTAHCSCLCKILISIRYYNFENYLFVFFALCWSVIHNPNKNGKVLVVMSQNVGEYKDIACCCCCFFFCESHTLIK